MNNHIFKKITVKYFQYFKMEDIKVPEFLNTEEKYNEIIRKMDTLGKYETLFITLLDDEDLPLVDILKLMKCIECDVILLQGIEEVSQLMEMSESFLRHMITMAEVSSKQNQKMDKPKSTHTRLMM